MGQHLLVRKVVMRVAMLKRCKHCTPSLHTHTTQNKQISVLTFTVRFEVAVYGWRLAFRHVHRSTWWGFGAGAKAHVGWRGHLFSKGGELHCARCHGHIVGLQDGF